MIIKKFQGKTEAEALTVAQKELGQNVVVMNVKEIKGKGFFAFLKAKSVEITVALEVEHDKSNSAVKEEKASIITPAVKKEISESNIEASNIENKLDSLKHLLEKQLQHPEPVEQEDVVKHTEEGVENKIKPSSEIVRFLELLHTTMASNEVDEKYIVQIIDEIEKSNKPNMPFDYALANTYQKMILKFGKKIKIEPAKEGVKVVYFVGPTGVGKTTTIAKIASKLSVEEKKKVALVTADTYRIAAVEQLRIYANILDVPFKVIYTIEEMKQSLNELTDYDYILVDTAGHSHKNAEQKQEMNQFLHSLDDLAEIETYLVLSATTKYTDLLNIVDAYKNMVEFRLIFTKLDETTSLGNLLNISLYSDSVISYVTCGQNVPDDIEEFNAQTTVKQLMGGKNSK